MPVCSGAIGRRRCLWDLRSPCPRAAGRKQRGFHHAQRSRPMNTPHSTRIGWLVSALITSGTVAAFILVFLLHPLAAGAAPSTQHAAQAAAAPVLTGHPQIARKNNRYNDALVAKKLSRLHK